MLSDKLQQEMMAAFDSQMNLNESDGKYKKKNIVDNGSEVIPNESDGKYETKDIGDDAPDFVAGEIISNEENMIENEEQYEIAHVSLDKGKRKVK